jgi:hypothetical protein
VRLEILYCAWNRLQFTSATWAWMMAHTNWDYVSKIVVYDDGSEDGTYEFLRDNAKPFRRKHRTIEVELRQSTLHAPAAIMNHYIATSEAEAFVKIDNDIALCGGWLEKMLHVFGENDVELLGMEAGMVSMQGRDGVNRKYGIEPCSHIGGVGMMSVQAFKSRPPVPFRIGDRIGFTEWQNRYDLKRAWIVPDLDVPQLDRLPFEPYLSLTEEYIERGWNREWGKYDEKWMSPYWGWM